MSRLDLAAHIQRRLDHFGRALAASQLDQLVAYVELLARWNRKINLTALTLDPADDNAIDRLIMEPVIAAAHVRRGDSSMLDIGSGGGSPALPFQIASGLPRLTMVEARERKAAFLREAARVLTLSAQVHAGRVEEFAVRPDAIGLFDVITIRAVELDKPLAALAHGMARANGQMFWFASSRERRNHDSEFSGWTQTDVAPLTRPEDVVAILEKAGDGR